MIVLIVLFSLTDLDSSTWKVRNVPAYCSWLPAIRQSLDEGIVHPFHSRSRLWHMPGRLCLMLLRPLEPKQEQQRATKVRTFSISGGFEVLIKTSMRGRRNRHRGADVCISCCSSHGQWIGTFGSQCSPGTPLGIREIGRRSLWRSRQAICW